MHCSNCGKTLPGSVPFCPHCGHRVLRRQAFEDHLHEMLRDRYEVINRIGQGGMAFVYDARDIALDRRVALKVLLPEFCSSEDQVLRFLQEARVAARLDNHPNIVRIYDVHQSGDINYFTMSLLEGGTLTQCIKKKGFLSPKEAAEIVAQVASALDHAHLQGVIHRDVKPDNILFDSTGSVVVTDFGIAKFSTSPGITRPGMVLGTPLYMSPEQIRGDDLRPTSDLYSLGIVFYEMLTGHPPFTGNESLAVMKRHLEEPPRPPEELRPGLPLELSRLVLRMLAKEPTLRFSSGRQLVAELSTLPIEPRLSFLASPKPTTQESEAPERISSPTPQAVQGESFAETTPARKSARRSLFRGLLAAAGVIVLGIGCWGIYRTLSAGDSPDDKVERTRYQQLLPELAGRSQDEKLTRLEAEASRASADASINAALASLYLEAHQYEKARQCLALVLQREPDNEEAGSDLASALYEMGRLDEAVNQLESLLEKHPNHAKSLFNLGFMLLAGRNDHAGAARRWRHLVETSPESPYAIQARARLEQLQTAP